MVDLSVSGKAGESDPGELTPMVDSGREFINYLQVERGLSVNTLSAYRRTLVRYLDFLASREIERPEMVTQDIVVSFANELRSPEGAALSARSVAQAFSAVRMYHRFLVTEGYAKKDPSGSLVSPRTPRRLPRALTREQVEHLLDAPTQGDEKGARDRLILEMLYATGMRISELVNLDVGDLEVAGRLVTCRGKGGKWRVVPFGTSAAHALEVYLEEARPQLAGKKRSGALILNLRGGRLTRQGCWKIVKGHARAVGLEDVVTPHGLRHTFATHLLEGGANLLVVQELLGHVSISTTQIYTEVTREHLREVYRKAHPRA